VSVSHGMCMLCCHFFKKIKFLVYLNNVGLYKFTSPLCTNGIFSVILFYQVNQSLKYLFIYFILFYLALPTRAGSPQQNMPITVGPFYLTHTVHFPCGRKPEYPGKTHNFRQSLDFYSFHMRTGFESH
jgi:hypothetical protein